LFERPKIGEMAVLVHIAFKSIPASKIDNEDVQEFSDLARSAFAEPVATVTGVRPKPEPRYLFGESKAEEIKEKIEQNSADLVLVNYRLSPAQERNLERLWCCRVLDRTSLILDIFAQRATSHEGRLQVELAQLRHLSTRLIRGWTHLERQKGGIGLRGPGETQLETDRRLIAVRIKQLQKRLLKVRNQRQQGRKARKKAELATVSLVGYTNAGKSTVFNQLTDSKIFAADQLFATLDPTLRRLKLTSTTSVVIADTVGFIRDLPHELVVAFRSTLEETKEAELLLHVIDASNLEFEQNINHVNVVLHDIDAADIPQLQVFNKIDQLHDVTPRIDYDDEGRPWRVWISALKGEGLTLLSQAIEQRLAGDIVTAWLQIEHVNVNGRLRALVFDSAEVKQEQMDSSSQHLRLLTRVLRSRLNKLLKNEPISIVPNEEIDPKPMLNSCG